MNRISGLIPGLVKHHETPVASFIRNRAVKKIVVGALVPEQLLDRQHDMAER
jgi:hypothetical protein